MTSYTIGEAAKTAGVTRRAVRLYESKGLLPVPDRTGSGYRLFTDDDIAILAFIRRGRSLGLSLDAIAEIIQISERCAPCERTAPSWRNDSPRSTLRLPTCIACEKRSTTPDGSRSINQPAPVAPSSSGSPNQTDYPRVGEPVAEVASDLARRAGSQRRTVGSNWWGTRRRRCSCRSGRRP